MASKKNNKNNLQKILFAVLAVAFALTYILSVVPSNKFSKRQESKVQKINIDFTKQGELQVLDSIGDTVVSFDIEIADNDFKTQQGLMFRNKMEANQGMLFIFKSEEPRFFWMKNTQIPLDLIFADKNKKVVSTHLNAVPFDTKTSLKSNVPAQYVFEIYGGLVEKLGIKVGHTLSWTRTEE